MRTRQEIFQYLLEWRTALESYIWSEGHAYCEFECPICRTSWRCVKDISGQLVEDQVEHDPDCLFYVLDHWND